MVSQNNFFKLSRFVHFVEVDGEYIGIFNALNLGTIVASSEVANFLKSKVIFEEDEIRNLTPHIPSLIKELKKHRMLVPINDSELNDYCFVQQHLSRHTSIKILYLLLTDACNLSCRYCYFEEAIPVQHKFSKMSKEVAKRGVDLFGRIVNQDIERNQDSEEFQIILYGGEPFLNWETMKWILEYIHDLRCKRKLPEKISVTINTNATLITKEIATSLRQFPFITLAVSIDGPKDIHDLYRIDRAGHPTFDQTHQGIRILQETGINFGVSCTLGEHNVDRAEEILVWLQNTYNVSSLGFNILIGTANLAIKNQQLYAERVTNKIISCFLIARERGIYEDRIMRKVRSFVDGHVYFYDCGGCGQQIVISPDGQIGVCQAYYGTKKYFTKFTDNFNPETHPYWAEWRMRSPLNISQCMDCIALANCGGGCPYTADIRNGSIWTLDETFCVFSQKVIIFLIKDLIRQILTKKNKG